MVGENRVKMSYSLIKRATVLPKTSDGSRPRVGVPYLSPSQIGSFERCEAAYYANYAKSMREPGKPVLMIGTGAHRFAEAYHELVMAGRPRNEWYDGALNESMKTIDKGLADDPKFDWDNPVWYQSPSFKQGMLVNVTIQDENVALKLDTVQLLKWRVEDAAKKLRPELDKYDPIRLEQGYFIEWADDLTLPILCFTDLIAHRKTDADAAAVRVMDYKTSGQAKKPIDVQRNVGLTAYSIGEGLTNGSEMIRDVGFINVVTTKAMSVATLDDIRIEDDIRRLYNAARVQTLKLRAGLIGIADNGQYCGNCFYKSWCENEFGGKRDVQEAIGSNSPAVAAQAVADASQLKIVA
jgi:hypothetical protein